MYLLKGTDNFNHISVYRIYIMITFKSSNKFLKKNVFSHSKPFKTSDFSQNVCMLGHYR